MSTATPTVIIADDHPLFRVALRLSVRNLAPGATVLEVDSFDSLKRAAALHPAADLVLLDLMMPGVEGLSSLQFLRGEFPQLRVAVVSSMPQATWLQLVQALGAVAFVHKSATPERMQDIVARLLAGDSWWPQLPQIDADAAGRPEDRLGQLSKQEVRVLLQLKDGRLNKQIAYDLEISESTVKTHISTILRKLDLYSRTQAALLAQRLLAGPETP